MSRSLAWKNLKGKPGRTIGLTVLSFLLAFCVLCGSLILTGLRSGLHSLDERLGADVMVVPYKASSQNYLEDQILMGNTGYYYMSGEVMDQIREKIEGIAQMSPQLFIATTTSSCCSYRVSIVGFDPATDFTITPWVQNSYDGTLQDDQIFVGHDMNAYAGDQLKFFGVPVTVAARLDETGTYLDTAVYMNMNTARKMVRAARELKLFSGKDYPTDTDDLISCVMIRTQDGYTAAEVEGAIKTYIRGIATAKTETSVEDISNKLNGIQNFAIGLIVVIWVLIFVIEIIAFHMTFGSRMKELAIYRINGASRRELAGLLMKEALIVSTIGGLVGAAVSVLVMELFSSQIENTLDMPFLLPRGMNLAMVVIGCVAVSILAGVLAAAASARKAGNVDAALILRGES